MDKNFIPHLYDKSNVTDMLDSYCAPLLTSPNPLTQMKAKRLLKYWALLNDTTFFSKRIPNVFYELNLELEKNFPDLSYEIIGRIKGLISALNKIEQIEDDILTKMKMDFLKQTFHVENMSEEEREEFLAIKLHEINSKRHTRLGTEFFKHLMNYDFDGKNPFDRVRDFFAFRIIIEDSEPQEQIEALYKVCDFIIDYFQSKTYEVMTSDPLIQTGDLEVESELIYIPKKSLISKKHAKYIKDYVIHPKKDGYQSLHFVVMDPYTERYFEVQIRTRSMDIISETIANHDMYKLLRYKKSKKARIDFSKIHVKGFRYYRYQDPITKEEKEYISDFAGITQSIPIKLEFDNFALI